MSRIGKLPIKIPENVDVNYNQNILRVKGKFGRLEKTIPNIIELRQDNEILYVNIKNKIRINRALHGLYRTLINNMLIGVSEQFKITLILKGVGYRAAIQDQFIILNLGYSHPVKIIIPDGITVEINQNTIINLKACDKEILGLFAANIRLYRPPEPYKGKGIIYKGEIVKRKAGKSGKK